MDELEYMTPDVIASCCPLEKRSAIYDCWEDSDGVWVMLEEDWFTADGAHTISLDGADQDCPLWMRIQMLNREFAAMTKGK